MKQRGRHLGIHQQTWEMQSPRSHLLRKVVVNHPRKVAVSPKKPPQKQQQVRGKKCSMRNQVGFQLVFAVSRVLRNAGTKFLLIWHAGTTFVIICVCVLLEMCVQGSTTTIMKQRGRHLGIHHRSCAMRRAGRSSRVVGTIAEMSTPCQAKRGLMI